MSSALARGASFTVGSGKCRDLNVVKAIRIKAWWVLSHKWDIYVTFSKAWGTSQESKKVRWEEGAERGGTLSSNQITALPSWSHSSCVSRQRTYVRLTWSTPCHARETTRWGRAVILCGADGKKKSCSCKQPSSSIWRDKQITPNGSQKTTWT